MKYLFSIVPIFVFILFIAFPASVTAKDKASPKAEHLKEVKKQQPAKEGENQESWEELNLKVINLYKEQKFMKASGLNKFVIHMARQLPEAEREKLSISLGNQSMISTHLGKFMDAEALAWEELALLQKIYGKRTVNTLKAWNHLAIIYTMAQVPEDAEKCLKTIIEIEEELYGKKNPKVIPSYKKLLKFYQISQNKKKEKELKKELKKMEKAAKTEGKGK